MKNKLYLIWILVAGIAGAVLRSSVLLTGYEAETGLPVEGFLPAKLLIGLTAIVVLSALLIGATGFAERKEWSYERMFGGRSVVCAVLCSLCGVGIIAVGALSILHAPEQILEQAVLYGDEVLMPSAVIRIAITVMGALGIATGLGMLLTSIGQIGAKQASKRTGLAATAAMFWSCLNLILVYHDNSGNPVLSAYSYALLLIIAVMIAFHSMGTYLYAEKGAVVRWYASAGTAIYLTLLHAGGSMLWQLRSHTDLSLTEWMGMGDALRLAAFVCIGIYLLLQLAGTLRMEPSGIAAETEE